ncbi:unnamed protein product [Periconia digitata]|uniref:Wax synthase domain-containing protein n=1 Tax=Periconia digitata TaxID=1303443 RepID=A0A9W4UE91_9PLEO|nr:unnamed protein product [Periconia digitata]
MDFVASLYPALTERQNLPQYYTPLCFFFSIVPFLTVHRRLAIVVTLPFLLYLCTCWPCFTSGGNSSDYYNGSLFAALPLWYIDFVLLTPRYGDTTPTFIGAKKARCSKETKISGLEGQQWKDCITFGERMRWSVRLMIPAQRGIGWNWQVKGDSVGPESELSHWQYIQNCLKKALVCYLNSVGALVMVGFGYTFRIAFNSDHYVQSALANGLVGISGAIWVWNRLECSYSLAAAIGVGTGLTGAWEWPPLMASLKSAWSVRQMWGTTYHQSCRRLLSQPAKQIVQILRLRKGSLPLAYFQLFISFGISCIFHQVQMFNVTRKDMGEFAFFMSQPLAIAAEDLVSCTWRHIPIYSENKRFGVIFGYVWVFVWFSLSTHQYVYGLIDANVMKDWLLGYLPFEYGADLAQGFRL